MRLRMRIRLRLELCVSFLKFVIWLLIFDSNLILSLEPRLAFTFFTAKKVNKKTPNPKNSL